MPAAEAVLTTWPLALLDHAGHEGPDAVRHGQQVDVDDPAPAVGGDGPAQPADSHAGIVAQHVDGAEALEGGVGQRVDRVVVAHVGRHGQHGLDAVLGGERLGGPVERVALDVGQHHPHALPGEPLRQRQADARRRARDRRDLAREVVHRR
jgi:hypothetical protein